MRHSNSKLGYDIYRWLVPMVRITLKIFMIILIDNTHSTIKFTSSHASTDVPLFDVRVSLANERRLVYMIYWPLQQAYRQTPSTDLYSKPTEKHQHLLYSSCNPLHTKTAIPFGLALRLRHVCSVSTPRIILALLNLGYNLNFVTERRHLPQFQFTNKRRQQT